MQENILYNRNQQNTFEQYQLVFSLHVNFANCIYLNLIKNYTKFLIARVELP
jgi:hypothetical protein